ncbi:TatD family hydrolase [Coraliomargarita sp. SDUM461004]|uniref:TatD family hydrolase n=1 Tax=Thalassobacterium sedimentorum TaxID=3041258 RepID=A0ABU1AME2_9BACT|nr:TatD family hydrolase [Coraliomargarita sp. SDUM461004]MDQ8195844.1 TatD family hydrolase [Coraliomargarita sp. SDUM461004]
MELIDSHCHLKGFKDKGELEPMLERAAGAGVQHFITVGTSPADWVSYREMHANYPGRIDYSVGLHPCYVDEDWADAVSQISTFFIPPHAPVAFGEIGLDYFHLPKDPLQAGETILLQEAAFRQQLMLASELDCPVIIHSREAFTESVQLIDESGIDWQRIVYHCFTYGAEEIAQINARGGRASFTGITTYKSATNVREALRQQGIERLMLETDCPYLTPEPHRGKPNEPAYLKNIAERCAESLAISLSELATCSSQNTKAFFQL